MNRIGFSVIIPAYNAASFISRAIESVKGQTFNSWEIIIVENGSSDNTYSICKSYESDKIRVFQSPKGVSNARNLGIDVAQGEWIVFLDADDELLANALLDFHHYISDEISLVVGKFEHNVIHNNSSFIFKTDIEKKSFLCDCLSDPTQKCTIKALAVQRQFLNDNSIRFKAELAYAEDSVFLVDVLRCGSNVAEIHSKVYRAYVNSTSAVHSMDSSVIERYRHSIVAIAKSLNLEDVDIENAFYIFVLCQLLVVLVNGVFSRSSFSTGVMWVRTLCNDECFTDAITMSKIAGVPLSKRIVFSLMKKKKYILLGVIIKMKSLYNSMKAV